MRNDTAAVGTGGLRLEADSYQPVCTPALDETHSSEEATDSTESAGTNADKKKWERLLREYRVVEYAFAIILYIIARRLGRWIKIHERECHAVR
jgi:hypothetical protein